MGVKQSNIMRKERRVRVFENRVLGRIFGPKKDEVTGECRKLHNDEINDLYTPNIVRVVKSKGMRWEGNVASMGGQARRIQDFGLEIGGKEPTWETQA